MKGGKRYMFCSKCGVEMNSDGNYCPKCGSFLTNINQPLPEDTVTAGSQKEYLFTWVKQFSYLTLKTVETKVILDRNTLTTESRTYYLGFIKGNLKTLTLPFSNIRAVQLKKLITYSDMAFAILFFIVGFANPLFFLLTALFLWTGINTSIVITTGLSNKIKIPAGNKNEAKELIQSLNTINPSNTASF